MSSRSPFKRHEWVRGKAPGVRGLVVLCKHCKGFKAYWLGVSGCPVRQRARRIGVTTPAQARRAVLAEELLESSAAGLEGT